MINQLVNIFCGDEHWVSVKVKTRIENLEKLGI